LISVRKEGRNYFYSLRRDVLHELLDSLWELGPTPRKVVDRKEGYVPRGKGQHLVDGGGREAPTNYEDATSDLDEALVLTW
jgi:hypothetical protein